MKQVFLLLTLILLFSACSQPRVSPQLDIDSTKAQIVVALLKGAESTYKNAIIDSLKADYASIAQIHVLTINKASELDNIDSDVLIVMEQLKAWLWMNGDFKKLISTADREKTLFVLTAGDVKYVYKGEPVKIISSASQKESPTRAYQYLKTNIDNILKDSE